MASHSEDILGNIVSKVKGNIAAVLFTIPAFTLMVGWCLKNITDYFNLQSSLVVFRSFTVLYFSLPLLVFALSQIPLRHYYRDRILPKGVRPIMLKTLFFGLFITIH